MEDLILKVGEFGVLGVVTIYLLTKGTDAVKDLANSNTSLAKSVKTLAEKVSAHDSRFNVIEHQLHAIESQIADLRRCLEGRNSHENFHQSRPRP